MTFHQMTTYFQMMVTDREDRIKQYILHLVENNASSSALRITLAALRNFYLMNDVEDIKWHKLKRFMGEETVPHEDRRYTHEEIHTLVQSSNLKLKAAILFMASSGCRIGALSNLTLSHLDKRADVYKINVYKGMKGKGQYYTFCTPEATNAIDTYLQFRERCGEKIGPQSPLFRKDFDSHFHELARNDVHPWKEKSITYAITNELVKIGLRELDHVNPHRNRKDVKLSHGFRKFFETMLVNANLHETIIRKLTGHSEQSNLTQLYSKQTEAEMLAEYEKAIDALTVDLANRLRKKVEKLEVEKNQFDQLAAKIASLEQKVKGFIDNVSQKRIDIEERLKNVITDNLHYPDFISKFNELVQSHPFFNNSDSEDEEANNDI